VARILVSEDVELLRGVIRRAPVEAGLRSRSRPTAPSRPWSASSPGRSRSPRSRPRWRRRW